VEFRSAWSSRPMSLSPTWAKLAFGMGPCSSLHFTKFNSASKIICQTLPILTAQLKNKAGLNFIIFMKQQNMCFTNSSFKFCHEVERKSPTFNTIYIKTFSSIAKPPRCVWLGSLGGTPVAAASPPSYAPFTSLLLESVAGTTQASGEEDDDAVSCFGPA
jgi:hypothetical protein